METLKRSDIEAYVKRLADEHGVPFGKTELDRLADTFTRLAGDEIETTPTEDMVVELRRRGIIDEETFARFLRFFLNSAGSDR